jgi:tetratricopeptide (TPR) repeat protein
MGPKSVQRLAILIALVLVAGPAIYFTQRKQVTRMAGAVLNEAQEAEKAGDFDGAIRKYQERLAVVPSDEATKEMLADVLQKGNKDEGRQTQATQLYAEILTRNPVRSDIRRRLAELLVERLQFKDARLHLEILKKHLESDKKDGKSGGTDGGLYFLLGRCQEEMGDFAGEDGAEKSYRTAIGQRAPQWIEATQRLANLLRGQLGKSDEADRLIDAMVAAAPDNYQVYLERGRYRRHFRLPGADADFRTALKSVPDEPQVYRELATLAEAKSNYDEARRVLQAGLKVAPKDPLLHLNLARVELHSGSVEKAIATLYSSLEVLPKQVVLRWNLADLLAQQGNTTDLMVQIEQLGGIGFNPPLVEFLQGSYEVNSGLWAKAILTLGRVQTRVEALPEIKARVNTLLARCYDQQGDPERRRDALKGAVRANPGYLPAQLALIEDQVKQGEIDQPIDGYRKLVPVLPSVRSRLLELLIVRNRQLPEGRRDWKEVEEFLKQESAASPESAGPLLLRAEMEAARGKPAEAQALVDSARQRFPRDVRCWVASAELLRQRGKLEPASALLDQAEKSLGDSVDLRRERAKISIARGGADLVKELDRLSRDTGSFPSQDRQGLLKALARELARFDDGLAAAGRIWSEVAALDPKAMEPQLHRLDVAYQVATKAEVARKANPQQATKQADAARAEIERIKDKIKQIDGVDGLNARYQEARYYIWQAQHAANATDKNTLRNAARSLIDDLSARRPDWSLIPLALASIVEQEIRENTEKLGDASLTKNPEKKKDLQREIKGLQESAANLYIQAIKQGQTNLAIVRRATDLLYATGRQEEMSQLWGQLPSGSIVGGGLQDEAVIAALKNRDFDRALELTRKAVEAHPNDFQERWLLAQILRLAGHEDEAVAELRKGVDLAPADPDRWHILVRFLVQGGRLADAERVIPAAEAALPKDKAPLELARYCMILGLTYQQARQDDRKTKWYDAASSWLKKAREARPDDPSITRMYTELLILRGQVKEVEAQLTAILGRAPTPENMDEISWARRVFAEILLSRKDLPSIRKALALFEQVQGPAAHGPDGKPARKPEDLRIIARVYEVQGTPAYLKQAIAALEQLMPTGLANPDDRYRLARLYIGEGDWPKAREQYRAIAALTQLRGTPEALNRYINYLDQYATELLRRSQDAADQEGLIEAQELVERLKVLRPESLEFLILEARLHRAKGELSKAIELIEAGGNRPKLPADSVQKLAAVAEEFGRVDLAERLLKQLAARPDRLENRLPLARFLARTGRVGPALDLCEPLWKTTKNPEGLVPTLLLGLVLGEKGEKRKAESAQVERLAGWLQKALEQRPNSSILLTGLGNLRERQGLFAEAEELYRRDIDRGEGDKVVSLNNLAWLIVLRDGKANGTALDLINRAIESRGPLPELLDTRGIVYLKSGDVQRAIEDLKQAVAGSPPADKYFHLAEAYLAANNKDEAKQSLEKARAAGLDPESLHALERGTYGQVLGALGVR